MATPPYPQRPDLEDLVAYLEGRGSDAMRALVLKRLDEDPDYLATMNDLVPMLREAGLIPEGGIAPASPEATESEPKSNVIGNASRFRRRTGLIAIAAALVPMGVGWWLFLARTIPLARQVANLVDASPAQLDAEIWKWPDTRGDASAPPSLADSGWSLVGAQIFDLTVTVNKRDFAAANTKAVALNRSLGNYAARTYSGVQGKLKEADFVWGEVDAEMKRADSELKKILDDDMKLVDKGTCVRAAFLARQAGNPDFEKSWPDACREALKDLDLDEEIKKMQELFGPDDLDWDEDDAAEAPPG